MWLLPSSLCALDTGASKSPSDQSTPDLQWWVTLSGKATQRPSSWPGWKTRPWSQHLFGAVTSKNFQLPHFSEWISSVLDLVVNLGAAPDEDAASMTTDGFGPALPTSFATWDPSSCSWRTCPRSSVEEDLPLFSGTWPNRVLYGVDSVTSVSGWRAPQKGKALYPGLHQRPTKQPIRRR